VSEAAPAPSLFGPTPLGVLDADALFAQQPTGPPPTPRHTGIEAMAEHIVTNFKYLPSTENLLWVGAGGRLALAAHPFDDDVNRALVGNSAAESFFKPGAVLGELYALLPTAATVYALGRIKDQPKVSHLGMDLIEALTMSEVGNFVTARNRPRTEILEAVSNCSCDWYIDSCGSKRYGQPLHMEGTCRRPLNGRRSRRILKAATSATTSMKSTRGKALAVGPSTSS
jgi:hypothetical protein